MPEPRVAHALICDEVRQEPSGRVSSIGVRGGDIVVDVARRGSALHFAVVAWLICDADDPPGRISLRIYGPPGRRLLSGNEVRPGVPQRRPDSTKAFYQLVVEHIALPLSQEGDIEVSLESETGILRAGRLRIRYANDMSLQPIGV